MKNTPEQLFNLLKEEFSYTKEKELINEAELGQIIELKPLVQMEASVKEPFWANFEKFLAEGGTLDPIVNNDMKYNTLDKEDKIKADPKLKFDFDNKLAGSYKVAEEVENIESHNYDYKAENVNNVNAQELLTGMQLEIKYNKDLTLDEAKELVVKNLSKDPLHYVKEGQFGVKGLGYTEPKVQENDGENYGGSGYSAKLKDSDNGLRLVKESYLKSTIKESLMGFLKEEEKEKPLPMDEDNFDEARDKAIEASQDKAGIEEKEKPDFADLDGDGDKKEPMKKAAADKKKVKKESIDSKLLEIGKEAEVVKLEAQLEYLSNHIDEKLERVNSINEDENLKELIDKNKLKDMQKEIKLLEKKKEGMEKMYEKMCGKSYQRAEMVDEISLDNE
jgi:hypothetical protein